MKLVFQQKGDSLPSKNRNESIDPYLIESITQNAKGVDDENDVDDVDEEMWKSRVDEEEEDTLGSRKLTADDLSRIVTQRQSPHVAKTVVTPQIPKPLDD